MSKPRKRRIVRRLIWCVVFLVWLPCAYIASYGVVHYLLWGGVVDQNLMFKIQGSVVYRPLNWYESTELPGSLRLTTISRWCIYHGQGSNMSWSQAVEGAKLQREGAKLLREMRRKDLEILRQQQALSPTQSDGSDQ